MATINREEIETFMSITGAPETIAIQRLQEHGGNLNEAVNAYFSEGDRNIVQEASITGALPPNDLMEIDDPPMVEPHGPTSLLSAARDADVNPFSLLDPTFGIGNSLFNSRSIFDTSSELMGRAPRAPFVSHPREVRQIPIEVKDGGDSLSAASGHGPRIQDVTDTLDLEGPLTRGTVIVADEDDDYIPGNAGGRGNNSRLTVPQFDDVPDGTNDIEEEMIRAAIEASKRDAELQSNQGLHDVPQRSPPQHDFADIEQAVSLSLKTTEQEQLQRETSFQAGASGSAANDPIVVEESGNIDRPIRRQGVGSSNKSSSTYQMKEGSSSAQDEADELDDQPLIRNRPRRRSSASAGVYREVAESETDPDPDPLPSTVANGNAFPSDEWGGISSEEHDEAVMLEAAMFGGIPENGYYPPHVPHQVMQPGFHTAWRMPRPPSPGLVAQRAIREQQDDEYLAALQADREKELKAIEDEKAAREAALEEQRKKEEESRRKVEEEQELERQLAAKEASLPDEPSLDNENALTLLVRMPDGSRRGRRFLKTDKLQSLFDFIDVGKAVKPGSYRLVRPYPRQAFSSGDSNLSLHELNLTSKQEALFLELV